MKYHIQLAHMFSSCIIIVWMGAQMGMLEFGYVPLFLIYSSFLLLFLTGFLSWFCISHVLELAGAAWSLGIGRIIKRTMGGMCYSLTDS
jgi:hypothetical protein